VDPKADMDDVEKIKFLTLPGLELQYLGRPASSYTDYVIPAPIGKDSELDISNTGLLYKALLIGIREEYSRIAPMQYNYTSMVIRHFDSVLFLFLSSNDPRTAPSFPFSPRIPSFPVGIYIICFNENLTRCLSTLEITRQSGWLLISQT
jgi:hypothetical protein